MATALPLPPAPPSQQWLAAKATLDALDTGDSGDRAFDEALVAAFSDQTERQQFLSWSAGVDAALLQADELNTDLPPLSTEKYRNALVVVNWASTDSVSGFHNGLYGLSRQIAADPLYLGQDNSILYYLQPETGWLDAKQDLGETKPQHPYVMEMSSVDGTKAPFAYGYCLGTLKYVHDGYTSVTPLPLQDTPLLVFLDVCAKGVWIVCLSEYRDWQGDPILLSLGSNVWDYLPSLQNGRELFKAMRVSNLDQLFKVDQQHPFFDAEARASAFDAFLQSWAVDPDVVKRAVASTK